jgi:HEAT repeat protein
MAGKTLSISFLVAVLLCVLGARTVATNDDPAYWIEYMRQKGREVRKEAREALIALGEAAVLILLETCEDDLHWLRWEAVNALGSIDIEDPGLVAPAISALVKRALTDTNVHPRWRSLWALSTFPSEEFEKTALPQLRAGQTEDDEGVVWNAVVALAYFLQSDVAPLLNQGLLENEDFAQWEAVYCLRMAHNEESVDLLSELIADTESTPKRLRQEAAMTLSHIADPKAVPALLTALEDPEAGVRWRAALALSKIGALAAIPAIEAALEKEVDEYAIEQMQTAIERLREASLKDEE